MKAPLRSSRPAGPVWCIVAGRHREHAFDGEGARLYGGRWNHPGTPAVYAASHLSLAALELFVHVDPDTVPDDLVAIPARLPEALEIEALPPSELPANWRAYPAPETVQAIGDTWLRSLSAPALLVPSAVLPRESNVLLNPEHPDFRRIEIGTPEQFSFDPRMWT